MDATITLENGVEVSFSGDADELAEVVMELSERKQRSAVSVPSRTEKVDWWKNYTYTSESQNGELVIEDMDTNHLLNALVKVARRDTQFFAEGGRITPNALRELFDDCETPAMISELAKRARMGDL